MKLWSKGLGSVELEVDFCHYSVVTEDKKTIIKGVTDEPVQWNFTITLGKDDIPGLMNVVFRFRTIRFILTNIKTLFLFIFEKALKRDNYVEKTLE